MTRILDMQSFEVFEVPEEHRDAPRGQSLHCALQQEDAGHVFVIEVYRVVHGTPGSTYLAPTSRDPAIDPCLFWQAGHPEGAFYMRPVMLIPATDEECRATGFRIRLQFNCPECAAESSVNVLLLDWLEWVWAQEPRNVADVFPYLTPPDRELFKTKLCRWCWAKTVSDGQQPADLPQREVEFASHLRQEEEFGFEMVGCFYCSGKHSTHDCRQKELIDRFWCALRYSE